MSEHDGKICINCRFWGEEGKCHNLPPHPQAGFPFTTANDWCGRWEPEAPNRRAEREAETLKDLA